MEFLAHIREGMSEREIQTAAEHSKNTAVYAGECLRSVGLKEAASMAGLVHDCGKFKEEFVQYLEDPKGRRGSVNHTFAGVRMIMERYHKDNTGTFQALTAELLALAAGGHHGLFDCVDENKVSGILHRLTKTDIHYAESKKNFLEHCISAEELDRKFGDAHRELEVIYDKLIHLTDTADEEKSAEESAFYLGLLSRLILSAVIEGDRRDTTEFMTGTTTTSSFENMSAFWTPYLTRVDEKLSRFAQNTPLQKARGEISAQCRTFGEKESGIYRLNIPTGGGKTLSSLRYALAHARKWGKQRLIFTSPLLSILDQNAAVLRDYLEDDSIILEHHSNVLQPEEQGELDQRELAVESWNTPVIITTLVQLLNTLFDGRTTAIRRFQALCNSVIVIDEVQTVPLKLLSMFNLAMNFLTEVCGTTILLCSATQPCLEQTNHPIRRCKGDLIPYKRDIWEPFRRTIITDAGGQSIDEIVSFALESLKSVQSLLVVCNKKDEADYLFCQLKEHADLSCHLSASMCIAHRRDTLRCLEDRLSTDQRCLCVATQVIEAGVDISFERVIRLSAGMDSVIQAAGRCNRNGACDEPVPVYIVPYLGEKLEMLREIQRGKDVTNGLLDKFRREPQEFDYDLSSDKAIAWYYRKLYQSLPVDYQDFPVAAKGTSIFQLLSCNDKYCDENAPYMSEFCMTQAFRTAGKLFHVFDNETVDLIVPYGAGEQLIEELTGNSYPNPEFLAGWLKRARPYTVAVYDWQLQRLGSAVNQYEGIHVLSAGFYDKNVGLRLGPAENEFLEV